MPLPAIRPCFVPKAGLVRRWLVGYFHHKLFLGPVHNHIHTTWLLLRKTLSTGPWLTQSRVPRTGTCVSFCWRIWWWRAGRAGGVWTCRSCSELCPRWPPSPCHPAPPTPDRHSSSEEPTRPTSSECARLGLRSHALICILLFSHESVYTCSL